MNKVIILAFALAITAHAACPNALGTLRSITPQATVGNEVALANANTVCSTLNTATKSCCALAQVNGIKTKADTLVTDLETLAGNKDKDILAARKKIAALRTQFTALSAAYTDAVKTKLTTLTSGNAAAGTLKTFLDAYVTDVTKFFTDYTKLRTGFETYQTARAACLTALVRAQVAGDCLGCHTDYQTTGVDATTSAITLDATLATALRTACYPYIVASAEQTNILRLAHFAAPVATYTENVVKLANSDDTDDAAAITAANAAIPSGAAAGISKVPAGCTDTACTFITTDFAPELVVDKTKTILGGSTSRRMLQSSNPARMLAGTFGSATTLTDEPKATFTVKPNPGSVTNVNDLSALRVGVFSCIVAFFVALLI
jgi:hypothetical protein